MIVGDADEWEFNKIPFEAIDQTRCCHIDEEPQFCELVSTYFGKINEDTTVMGETDAQTGLDRIIDVPIDRVINDYEIPVARKVNTVFPSHL